MQEGCVWPTNSLFTSGMSAMRANKFSSYEVSSSVPCQHVNTQCVRHLLLCNCVDTVDLWLSALMLCVFYWFQRTKWTNRQHPSCSPHWLPVFQLSSVKTKEANWSVLIASDSHLLEIKNPKISAAVLANDCKIHSKVILFYSTSTLSLSGTYLHVKLSVSQL